MTEAVINNGCLAHNCIYNIMINSIVIFHHLSQCRVRGRNCISFLVGCIHTEAAQHHSQHFPLLFHCSPKAVFQYWLRFLGPHQAINVFSIFKNAWSIFLGKSFCRQFPSDYRITLHIHHSKSIISFWSHQLSQVHAGGRMVRTMGLTN